MRGIKGPVGTAQDTLDLLGDDPARLADLEGRVAAHLGFDRVLDSVGQVYPRSLDYDVVSALVQTAAGPSSLATTIRLMAGLELVTEGFQPGQVGSSAMPHKMNTRSCERVNGLTVLLRGYASMVGELAGDQWNEGDVSCSVVRRVALPDAFFAADGLFETFLTVLDEFGVFPAVVERELDRYLPFLATTKVLMASVRAGVGRETAHEAIKEQAVAVALEMRESGAEGNDLFDRLAADPRLGLSRADLDALVRAPITFTGAAVDQVARVVAKVEVVAAAHPEAASYSPGRDPVTPEGLTSEPATSATSGVEVRAASYGDADVVALVAEVQAHYVEIYGGEDETPMTPEDFEAPEGTFVVAAIDGEPVGCGAFRGTTARSAGRDQADVRASRRTAVAAWRGRCSADLERRAAPPATRGSCWRRAPASPRRIALYSERRLHRDRALRLLPLQPPESLLRQRSGLHG